MLNINSNLQIYQPLCAFIDIRIILIFVFAPILLILMESNQQQNREIFQCFVFSILVLYQLQHHNYIIITTFFFYLSQKEMLLKNLTLHANYVKNIKFAFMRTASQINTTKMNHNIEDQAIINNPFQDSQQKKYFQTTPPTIKNTNSGLVINNDKNNQSRIFNSKNIFCFSSVGTQSQSAQLKPTRESTQNQEREETKAEKILQNVKIASKILKGYDSIFLDDCCQIFSSLYINKHPKQIEKQQQKKLNLNLKNNNFNSIDGQKIIKNAQNKIIYKIMQRLKEHCQTQNHLVKLEKQLRVEAETINHKIRTIFRFLDKAKIGFLRGDIHSQTIYKLESYIQSFQSRVNSQMSFGLRLKGQRPNFDVDQFRAFFNHVTQPQSFRLPEKGIKYRQLQSKNNLYQRQLSLESVSNQQAFQKFNSVLQSLATLNKAHLTQVSRRQIVEWLPPIIKAIKEQQAKCKMKDNQEKRKVYAEHLIKVNPQKIAALILYDLVALIYEILFVGGEDCFQANQFHGISEKKICRNICKLIISQLIYERQEKKFKQIQKVYDFVLEMEPKFTSQEIVQQRQYQKLQEITRQHIKPEYLIEYLAICKKPQTKIADPPGSQTNQSQASKKAEEQGQMFKRKHALRKYMQQKFEYKYIRPEDRKHFLSQLVNKITKRDSWKNNLDRQQIPQQAQLQIGLLLVSIMKDYIKVKNKYGFLVPLLIPQRKFFTQKTGEVTTLNILKVNEHFLATILPKIQKQGDLFMHQQRSIPTIIPPLPWVQPQVGGYYLQATNIMRFSECTMQQRIVRYADMSRVYNVLNFLSCTPWQINKNILAVVQQLWAEGGGVGQIPVRYTQLITIYTSKMKKQKNPKIIKEYTKKIQQLRDCHSQKCDFLLKLAIARSFSKVQKFYFPHNLDFRGRVYPVPPHFNHIGNDFARGMLLFGEGQRLGQSGLKWLKIHCANLMGKDKATIPQKLQFIQQNLHLIKDIANNPLKNRIWLKNQDCWQSLGAIFDLNNALNHNPPQDYISYLHIHQDGSCNGLQHYAALGRDMEGAYQVNLGVTERPGDVYTHVAKMVIKMINEDIANPSSDNRQLALKLTDNIKRKTIKQTVMTSVYGVTFIGARQQIHRQLRDQNFLGDDQSYKASIYVAKLTLKAISNLFTGAHDIKQWLIQSAKLIAESNNPVGWITPMGLPVVQPYRNISRLDTISTVTQILKVPPETQLLPINKSKQKSAFPPNFVHSLDSTHMMYTAQECSKKNLIFAAVHDSYWTHAGKVQEMNVILRDMFVKLHSEPLLESLKKSFELRYPQIVFPQIPKRGQFNLQIVKKSIYFFS